MSKLNEQDQANLNRISELLAELKPLVENAEKLLAQNTIAQTEWKVGEWAWSKGKRFLGTVEHKNGAIMLNGQDTTFWATSPQSLTKPTPEEIQSHLTKIAEQLGFKEWAIISQKGWGGMSNITIGKEPIVFRNDILYCGGWAIWYKGQWASILEVEPIKEERWKVEVYNPNITGNEGFKIHIEPTFKLREPRAIEISEKIKQLLKEL